MNAVWEVQGVRWSLAGGTDAERQVVLVGLPLAGDSHGTADAEVRLRLVGAGLRTDLRWRRGAYGLDYFTRADGDEVWFRTRQGSVLRAVVSPATLDIALGEGETPEGLAEGLAPAVPFLFASTGRFPLHAASVVMHGTRVLLAGPQGSGKSTTAARLSQFGGRLEADDLVLLREAAEGVVVLPCARGSAGPRAPAVLPNLLLFPSVRGGLTCLRRLPARAALGRLVGLGVMPGPEERVRRHLSLLGRLAATSPAWELDLGPDFDGWWSDHGLRRLAVG